MIDSIRTVDTITAEILVIRDNVRKIVLESVVEIGNRLLEAKELVPQGEWGRYLENVLEFKPSTAQNYMRIAKEMGSGQIGIISGKSSYDVFGSLGYSQLLPLLGMSDEDKLQLAQQNDLEHLSSREIGKLVADFKAAKAEAERVKSLYDESQKLAERAEKAEEQYKKAAENEKAARERLERKNNELTGKVQELMEKIESNTISAQMIPEEETIRRIRAEISAEQAQAVREAEERAREALLKLEKAKNPMVLNANFLFGELVSVYDRLYVCLGNLSREQPELSEKLKTVIFQKLEEMAQEFCDDLTVGKES